MRYFFPYAVAVLEFGAGFVYLYHKQYALAVTWLAYGIAAMGLASVR